MTADAETLWSISVTKAKTDEGMHVENQYKLQGSKYGALMERVSDGLVGALVFFQSSNGDTWSDRPSHAWQHLPTCRDVPISCSKRTNLLAEEEGAEQTPTSLGR